MIPIVKPVIEQQEIAAVTDVLRSGMLAQGPIVRELEIAFAKYCSVKYAVAFNSGTAAIHAGLYALGIKEGDEVITSPFTFVASASPILMRGAKVIFADVSGDDFNIDPKEVQRRVSKKTKAIIPVDLYGQIHNHKEIAKIARKHKLSILEDACQSIGAQQNNRVAGTFGNVGAFSLYATKNMTSGEGGLIVTNNKTVMEKCKMFRHHGQTETGQYQYRDLGYNYRLSDICAAIALGQLRRLDNLNLRRISNARKLSMGLKEIKGLITPVVKADNKHVFHQYTIRVTSALKVTRDELMERLRIKGIGCNVYYPKPLHLHPVFTKLGYKKGDFPVAEEMSREVLSLPVHPSLEDRDIDYIVETISRVCSTSVW